MSIGAGDLVVRLRTDHRGYTRGFAEATGSTRALADQTEGTGRVLTRQTRRMRSQRQVVSNLSFAIEDMASVYGTQGLAGAVRASANNFTMMASALGPQALLVASVTSAVAQLGLAWLNAADNAEKSAERQEQAAKSTRDSLERAERRREFARDTASPGGGDASAAVERTARLSQDLRELESQIRERQAVVEFRSDQAEFIRSTRAEVDEFLTTPFAGGAKRSILPEDLLRRRRQADLLEEEGFGVDDKVLAEVNEELGTLRNRARDLQEALGGARRAANEAAAADAADAAVARRSEMFNAQRRSELARRRASRTALQEDANAGAEFTRARRAEMFNAQRRERLARRRAEREQERDLLERAGDQALAELERNSQDTLRRVNPNLSAQQSQFLAGQALGGGVLSDEKKRARLAELTEKHLAKLRQIAEREERQQQATTAEEFAVATFP